MELITYQCFRYSWTVLSQHQGHFIFQLLLKGIGLELHEEVGEDTAERDKLSRQKGYPMTYNIVLMNKSSGKGGKVKYSLWVTAFFFSITCYMYWGLAFQDAAKHLPAHGQQWMHSLFCFACTCSFASLPKLSLSWLTICCEFLRFCSSFFLAHLPAGNERLGGGSPVGWDQSEFPLKRL